MKKNLLLAVGVLLVIMAVIYLSERSRLAATVGGMAFDAVLVAVVVGGSIYKLALWWRYRHDPARREQVVFSNPFYPPRRRRFFYDETDDSAKKP